MAKADDFKLDTSNMDQVASLCSQLGDEMRNMKQKLDRAKTDTVNKWDGEGSKTFQKKYHLLVQQLTDITDGLFDLAEGIYDAQDSYIQADVDAAKLLEGASAPEGHAG